MIGTQVYQFLSAQSAITSIVGNRIVPNYVNVKLGYPQLVYECKNVKSDADFDGSGNPYTMELSLLCIDERDYLSADRLAQAVVGLLDGYMGQWGSIKVLGVFLEDATEDYVVEPNSERVLYFMKELQFTIVYEV